MKVSAITLLLSMAGASALGIKPAKARAMADAARRMQESLQKLQVFNDAMMQGRRLESHDALDMAGLMKPECKEACPGVEAMMQSFMDLATKSTTAPPAGKESEAMMAMLKDILCPHMKALKCSSEVDECSSKKRRLDKHEGEPDMLAALSCICVCPDLASMASGSRRLDDSDDAAMKAVCANPKGTIGCMISESECEVFEAGMKKEMPKEVQGADDDEMMGYVGIQCDWESNKCESKFDMSKCDGGKAAETDYNTKKCEEKETTDKKPCCDGVKKMAECAGEKCMKLGLVITEIEDEKKMEEILKINAACSDVVGMPKDMPKTKDEVKAVKEVSEKKLKSEAGVTTKAPATTTAAGGDASGAFHTIPAFGMVTTVLAFAAVANI